jgi:hypothetical protein
LILLDIFVSTYSQTGQHSNIVIRDVTVDEISHDAYQKSDGSDWPSSLAFKRGRQGQKWYVDNKTPVEGARSTNAVPVHNIKAVRDVTCE